MGTNTTTVVATKATAVVDASPTRPANIPITLFSRPEAADPRDV